MSASYDVKLTLKFKDRKKAEEALLNYISENNLDEHPTSMETIFENLLKYKSVNNSYEHVFIDDNTEYYGSSVERDFIFESIILNVFSSMKEYLFDDSSLELYPESGYFRYQLTEGKIREYFVDEMLNPFFDTVELMYEDIEERDGYGYYNTYTHTYVFYDERKGKLCHVALDETEIPRICKEIRDNDSDDTKWQHFIDPTRLCWEDTEEDAIAFLDKINNTPCPERGLPFAKECWVVASDCTEYYC